MIWVNPDHKFLTTDGKMLAIAFITADTKSGAIVVS
jgi:hypothetical protein